MHRRGKTHYAQRHELWPVSDFAEMFIFSNFLRVLLWLDRHDKGQSVLVESMFINFIVTVVYGNYSLLGFFFENPR